jgi:hypothetical protein
LLNALLGFFLHTHDVVELVFLQVLLESDDLLLSSYIGWILDPKCSPEVGVLPLLLLDHEIDFLQVFEDAFLLFVHGFRSADVLLELVALFFIPGLMNLLSFLFVDGVVFVVEERMAGFATQLEHCGKHLVVPVLDLVDVPCAPIEIESVCNHDELVIEEKHLLEQVRRLLETPRIMLDILRLK